ncbi:MAG: aldehyde dehydrogenase family protein [bacterium]|nr:aldehyde dehydrogenase family protein [bacterium]
MDRRKSLIAGQCTDSDEEFAVNNPYNGQHLADVANAGSELIERSLAAARSAADKMRSLPRFQIAKGLRAISARIEERKEDFTRSIALESAKPVICARGEVDRAIATFSWAAGEAERYAGETVPIDVQASGRSKWGRTIRVPRGVIYGVTPFNFPLNLVAHKVAPALATGNAIIIKPSPRTPLTSLLLGEVFLESGLPSAALQIVPTDVANVLRIVNDDRVAMISFTGSAAVGWELKNNVGKKPIALELGGNAPVIIDESADLERSLSRTLLGSFAYSGQVCISVQRVYIHCSNFEEWISGFVSGAEALKRGDPLDEKTQISVMIDQAAAERAEAWTNEAVDNGAKILSGGKRDRSFFEPTILTNTDPEMLVVAEEVFAPIVVVEKVGSFEEGLDAANNSKYGLQAGVFSNDQDNINLAIERLEYGGIIINDAPIFRVDNMPYGGMKESGFGREGVRYAMDEMTEIKLVVQDS